MNSAFLYIGAAFIFVASLVHLLIFFMESVLWSDPKIWKRFGVKSQEDADVLKPMAYNQGFYNVFLALGAGVGLVMLGSTDWVQGGVALTIFAGSAMVLAAVVLLTSSRKLWRAAIFQGAAPLVGVILLLLAILA
jgi:putative membrane protein